MQSQLALHNDMEEDLAVMEAAFAVIEDGGQQYKNLFSKEEQVQLHLNNAKSLSIEAIAR